MITAGGALMKALGMLVGGVAGHAGVAVVEEDVVVEAEDADGAGEFGLGGRRPKSPRVAAPGWRISPSLAQGGGNEADGDAAGGVGGKGAADGKGFVVGVGEAS